MANHGKAHAHEHHIVPQSTLTLVFLMLIGLMVATILAAFVIHLPTFWMNVIALGIAVTKASFVVMVFMGVKYSTRLVKLFALGGFAWFFLLFLMLADYVTRPSEPVVGWEEQPASALPRGTVDQPD